MTPTKKHKASLITAVSSFSENGKTFPHLSDMDGSFFGLNERALTLPHTNITESGNLYNIELAAPGLKRKDFKVAVNNGMLTISAEKEEGKDEKHKHYRRQEFSYQSFHRSFTLPENSLPDKIEAKYEHGILHLSLPKKEVFNAKHTRDIKVA